MLLYLRNTIEFFELFVWLYWLAWANNVLLVWAVRTEYWCYDSLLYNDLPVCPIENEEQHLHEIL